RPGTCLPSTTRHTVSGDAISKPSGPHSHVQNVTHTSSTPCATPTAPAYSTVSSTRFVNSSRTTNKARTINGPVHPFGAAKLTGIGAPAASTGPTYGTNRSAAPSQEVRPRPRAELEEREFRDLLLCR